MSVYYNEFDPGAAAWLSELMNEGLIPKGVIDTRSITEIKAHELDGFTHCHFFAGIGGWPLAFDLAGIPDDEEWWTGSCPCQPFSGTGKQLGNADPRHLFPAFRKLIARRNPARVAGEQVASGLGREWLARVRLEMATLGYATRAADLCSAGVAAPNIRQRLYWLSDTDGRKPWNGRIQSSGEYGQLAQDGGVSGVGNAMRFGRNEGTRLNGKIGGSRSGQSESAESGGSERLGDTSCNGTQRSGAGECEPDAAGSSLRLVHPHDPRPQGRDERGHGGCERITGEAGLAGTDCLPATGKCLPTAGGFWDNFDILHCTDGKARRIESGSFPLAHGIPGRVGLLRGYGNAINPFVAASFLKACRQAGRGNLVVEDWS